MPEHFTLAFANRFNSLVKIKVVMTGMGDDEAKGIKNLHNVDALTIAQNEETCTVYGMPKLVVQLGVADHVLALDRIAPLMGLWAKAQGLGV